MKQESKQDIILRLTEGLNAQQRSVPQLPAQARARKIKVLGAKTDPKHPFDGYMVGADESAEPGKKNIGPDKNNPYEKGWRAGFRHNESNPYPAGSKQAAQWDRGYAEAEAQPNHYDESLAEVDFNPGRRGFLKKAGAVAATAAMPTGLAGAAAKAMAPAASIISAPFVGLAAIDLDEIINLLDSADAKNMRPGHDPYDLDIMKSIAQDAARESWGNAWFMNGNTPKAFLDAVELGRKNGMSDQDIIDNLKSTATDLFADEMELLKPEDKRKVQSQSLRTPNVSEPAASPTTGMSGLARAAGAQIGRTMKNVGKATADTILNQPARDMGRIEPTTAPAALPAPSVSPGMQIPKQKSRVDASPFNDDHSELDQFVKEEFNRHPDDINEESGAVIAHGYAYNRQDQRVAWTREFASETEATEWARRRNATVLSIVPKDSIEEGWKSKLAGAALAGAAAFGGGGAQANDQIAKDTQGIGQAFRSGQMAPKQYAPGEISLSQIHSHPKWLETVQAMIKKYPKNHEDDQRAQTAAREAIKQMIQQGNVREGADTAGRNNPAAAWPEFGTAKTYESQLAEAKQQLAEGTITKTPTGIKHTGTYGTDAHDPYKSWGRSKTRGRPTKSNYVGRDVDIDEPKKRYGAPPLGRQIGPGAKPTPSSPVVSRSYDSATSPIASSGLAVDLPQQIQDKIYAQSDFDRAKKNPGTIGRTKKPDGEVPILDLDEAESRYVLYFNGKPASHYATEAEAKRIADSIKAKHPTVKIEIKNEMHEGNLNEVTGDLPFDTMLSKIVAGGNLQTLAAKIVAKIKKFPQYRMPDENGDRDEFDWPNGYPDGHFFGDDLWIDDSFNSIMEKWKSLGPDKFADENQELSFKPSMESSNDYTSYWNGVLEVLRRLESIPGATEQLAKMVWHGLFSGNVEQGITDIGRKGVAEGAKVDRMVKHIASSEKAAGKSKKDAENIAWATVNKRGMLDNKNKKKHVAEAGTPADIRAKNRAVVKKIQGKEADIDEGWKSKLAGAALAGAAALGGGAQAQTAPATGVNATGNNSAIVQSLVNPVAQQRFAAQHADTTAKLSDPRYDHNPNALSQHAAYPKELHNQWIENVRNAAQFDNPYQIIRTALNMAGLTPQEVLQNLPKGYKLPTTEPKGTFVPTGTPVPASVKEDITQEDIITKLKAKLGDYLSDLGQQIKKDPALQDKLSAETPGDQVGPPVKTLTTDDGHEISIHGNEDDGFRISIKNKQTPSKFDSLDEAVMACEMYRAHRRKQALNADYVEEA